MKENVALMLQSVFNNDKLGAEQAFNTVIGDKVSAALENLKVDIADRTFNHEPVSEESKPAFGGTPAKQNYPVKDKSGAVHTPMSRARDLARRGMHDMETKLEKAKE